MDSYLDLMDNNIAGMTEFLSESLSGQALAGLNRSQAAFSEYRRQNCLWYLEFSSPRSEAELIAKNCLATMSNHRWQELQGLLGEEDTSAKTVSGFYVYGEGRNSFQQCGSEALYWLDGDLSVVNDAQQLYLSLATSKVQILHAVFAGSLNESTAAPQGHVGVLSLSTLFDMSVPTETDCKLLSNSSVFDLASSTTVDSSAVTTSEEILDSAEQDEPQQQLIAYFGAWLVDCTENNGRRSCNLKVALDKLVSSDSERASATLIVLRGKQQRTSIEMIFPDREIESPSLVRWRIDAFAFGDLVGSSILVDEIAARQIIPGEGFLKNELLPMMIEGVDLSIEVLAGVDDSAGEEFVGTLNGLTKALAFSDGFVRDSTE
ncbi:MAG: invasion protein IalB [Halioglobus sp.]|jgi:invasion protein IalB